MILEKVQSIYQDNLKKAFKEEEKKAMTYLKGRGFSDETIQEFGVGYSNGNIKTKLKEVKSELVQQGILNARYNERNYQRLMFPLHNESGEIIGFNGRTLKEKNEDDKIYVKYLLSPESLEFSKSKTLFNLHRAKEHIQNQGSVYIVEGVMDCMTLWELGKKNVVCTLGTALSKEHIQLLKKYTDKFIICYDNDIAGFSASVRNGRFISQAMRDFLNDKSVETWSATKQILFTKLPINHDPNDLYLKDKSSLDFRLEQPLQYIDYCRQMCIENMQYLKQNYVIPYQKANQRMVATEKER